MPEVGLKKGGNVPLNTVLDAIEGKTDPLRDLNLTIDGAEKILKTGDRVLGFLERLEKTRIGRALALRVEQAAGVEGDQNLPPGVKRVDAGHRGTKDTKGHSDAHSIIDRMTAKEAQQFADTIKKKLAAAAKKQAKK